MLFIIPLAGRPSEAAAAAAYTPNTPNSLGKFPDAAKLVLVPWHR